MRVSVRHGLKRDGTGFDDAGFDDAEFNDTGFVDKELGEAGPGETGLDGARRGHAGRHDSAAAGMRRGVLGRRASRGTVLLLAATLALTGGLATACGSSSSSGSGGAVTIRFVWWGNADRAKATDAAVAAFEKANPGVTVKTEYASYDAYFQKLATEVAGGDSPDLIQLDRATLGEYQQKGVLLPLDPYAGKSLRTSDISPLLLASGRISGGQYAVPGGQTTQMLVYDKTLWSRAGASPPAAGWTWAQFASMSEAVGKATGTPGSTDFGWAIDWFEAYLAQHGKHLYTPDGKLGFTADDLAAFWNLTGTIRAADGLSKPTATTKMDGSTANSALVTKQAASEVNYDSNLTGYLKAYSGGTLAEAPLPTDDPAVSGLAAMPPVSFAVSKRSAHPDAAVKLLDFITNDPGAGAILGTSRGLPPNLATRASVCAKASPSDKAVCAYEDSVKSIVGPSFGNWPIGSAAVKRDFQQIYDDVIFGRTSVSAGAARVVGDAQQTLSQP
jgi:pectin-derived oligosaccharide transport system substrate-binding protein